MTAMITEETLEPAGELIDQRDAQQAFDEEQISAITSTDVAAILLLSKYGTPLTVHRAKRGEAPERQPGLPAWVGLRMENMVGELYTAATGIRIRADNQFHRHRAYEWFGCHLDRRAVGDPRLIVELKTRNSMRGWGPDGSQEIPPDVWCQVQAQMEICGARECHVATLFGNSEFRVYPIAPAPDFIEKLLPTLERFWYDHVIAGVPPAPTGHERDSEIVKSTPGGNTGVIRPATPEQSAVVHQLRVARTAFAAAKFTKDGLENAVKQIIGEDADGIEGPFGLITWKRTKDWTKYDYETMAEVYRKAALEVITVALRAESALAPEDREAITVAQSVIEVAPSLYGERKKGTRRLDLRHLKEED